MTDVVKFEVINIEEANKLGYVKIDLKFDANPWKTYNYIRKNNDGVAIIDGCAVKFNKYTFQVYSIERLYNTAGVKKADTSNIAGKITEELKSKGFAVPEKIEVVEIDLDEEIKEIVEEVLENGEVHHEQYNSIKMCILNQIPVYLAGPAGSGKNHTVEQIANELGYSFYFSNSVQQEFKLTGFIDAGGKFHETEFYKACTDENDSIFFLDEMDASIPEVLVLLNAAIANGYFEFPTGRVDFKNVHFVSAGNTMGSGADEMYTGRMVLDQATLDRFAIIEFDYSIKIEKSITKNNMELINFVHELRSESKRKGIRATFSYRCMTMVTKLELAGMNLVEAMKISITKGMDKDTINTLTPYGESKYHKALRNIQRAA